jgi:hypothetical protein
LTEHQPQNVEHAGAERDADAHLGQSASAAILFALLPAIEFPPNRRRNAPLVPRPPAGAVFRSSLVRRCWTVLNCSGSPPANTRGSTTQIPATDSKTRFRRSISAYIGPESGARAWRNGAQIRTSRPGSRYGSGCSNTP